MYLLGLGVIFLVMKYFGLGPVAAWEWWWVLSPIWIGFSLFFVGMSVAVVFGLIAAVRPSPLEKVMRDIRKSKGIA